MSRLAEKQIQGVAIWVSVTRPHGLRAGFKLCRRCCVFVILKITYYNRFLKGDLRNHVTRVLLIHPSTSDRGEARQVIIEDLIGGCYVGSGCNPTDTGTARVCDLDPKMTGRTLLSLFPRSETAGWCSAGERAPSRSFPAFVHLAIFLFRKRSLCTERGGRFQALISPFVEQSHTSSSHLYPFFALNGCILRPLLSASHFSWHVNGSASADPRLTEAPTAKDIRLEIAFARAL